MPPFDGFCCGHSYLKYSDINGCTCRCEQCLALNCEKLNQKSYQVKIHVKSEHANVKESKLDFVDDKDDKNDETKQESMGDRSGCATTR